MEKRMRPGHILARMIIAICVITVVVVFEKDMRENNPEAHTLWFGEQK